MGVWVMEGRVGLVGVRGGPWVAVGAGGSQGRQCAVVLGGELWEWRGVAYVAEMAFDGWW